MLGVSSWFLETLKCTKFREELLTLDHRKWCNFKRRGCWGIEIYICYTNCDKYSKDSYMFAVICDL